MTKNVFPCVVKVASTLAVLVSLSWATVTPNGLFKDGMVLQRDMNVPVWGTADANEAVTVKFLTQTVTTTTSGSGKWTLNLAPTVAGGPWPLTISGTKGELTTLPSVYVGDVWVCSGQSNMDRMISESDAETQTAVNDNYPQLRLVKSGSAAAWTGASSSTIGSFSAVGYWFGRTVYLAQNIPIGLIWASVPGTMIDSWCTGGDNYNTKILPLIPCAIKGVAWYQGEWDTDRWAIYRECMDTLITGWRKAWGQGDFPFVYEQLHKGAGSYVMSTMSVFTDWANQREAQSLALSIPNTAMAVTFDVSNNDAHPPEKGPMGERLGWATCSAIYKNKAAADGISPFFKSVSMQGTNAVLSFNNAENGLTAQGSAGGAVNDIYLLYAGNITSTKVAKATVSGSTVVVDLSGESNVAGIYYSWCSYPMGNVFNAAGLPVSPFRVESISFHPVAFSQTTITLRANRLLDPTTAEVAANYQVSGRNVTNAVLAERGLSVVLTVDKPFVPFEKLTIAFPAIKTWDAKATINPLLCTVLPGTVCTGYWFKEYLLNFNTTEAVADTSQPCIGTDWKLAHNDRGAVSISPWAGSAAANVTVFGQLYLYSDSSRFARIKSVSANLTKIFLSGSPVAITTAMSPTEDYTAAITLPQGWSSLVLETQNTTTSRFSVRLVDTNGCWLRGVSYRAGCDSTLTAIGAQSRPVISGEDRSLAITRSSSGLRILVSSPGNHWVSVMSLSGKIVAQYSGKNPAVYTLDRRALAPAVYVIRCTSEGKTQEIKTPWFPW